MKPSRTISGILLAAVMLSGCQKNELMPEVPGKWQKTVFDYYYLRCQSAVSGKPDLMDLDVRFVCECTLEGLAQRMGMQALEQSAGKTDSAVDNALQTETERCYQRYLR